jgi:Zn-dependent M28 family amino/carboxypeptidase
MSSTTAFGYTADQTAMKTSRSMKLILAAIGVAILLTIAVLGLAIATLVKVSNNQSSTTPTNPKPLDSVLAESIRIADVMTHLNELQRIATSNNGNRAVSTSGFNQTLDYITSKLSSEENLIVSRNYFPIRQFALDGEPIFMSSINGVSTTYKYSTTLSAADFYYIQFSTGTNSPFVALSVIPGVGCSDDDWQKASASPAGRVALVKRGICGFPEKGALAAKYGALAILIYNDGAAPDRVSPISIGLGQENNLPALFLSFPVGQALADAAQNASTNTTVRLVINVQNLPLSPVGNICADTRTGDATQTIVIGSHSDGVPEGPGVNDNGMRAKHFSDY